MAQHTIKSIDDHSIHRITSGQVVIDLQTAVKELVENSLDAGATSIEVRFKEYGLDNVEVIDNGSGIASEDYEAVALKHHTSKLLSFEDLPSVLSFGFRGEALSSLCALCETVIVVTATADDAPMGTILEFDPSGKLTSKSGKIARQKGTTVTFAGLFKSLPVRRKELERNAKREFGKALNLLNAYALLPCVKENRGVRLVCSNSVKGRKAVHLRVDGFSSRSSISALWGAKSMENIVDLNLHFQVETEKSVLRRQGSKNKDVRHAIDVRVHGLISKFVVGGGRSGTDRQFFYVNGRPCNPTKVQKAFNEVYRTFNINQSPFIVADFIVPTDALDINVSPDKRTIFIHSESSLVQALKIALEESFSVSRATYDLSTQNDAVLKHHKEKPLNEISSFSEAEAEPYSGDGEDFGEPLFLAEEIDNHNAADDSASSILSTPLDADQAAASAQHDSILSPTTTQMATQMQVDTTEQHPARRTVGSDSEDANTVPETVRDARASSIIPSSKRPPHSTRSIQMVLSTQNASWNLRQSADSDSDRPRKRQKRDRDASHSGIPSRSHKDLLTHLVDFARGGSQVIVSKELAPEDSGTEESEEGEVIDPLVASEPEVDLDADDHDDCIIDVSSSSSRTATLEDDGDLSNAPTDKMVVCEDAPIIDLSHGGGIEDSPLDDACSHVDDGDESASNLSRGAPHLQEVIRTVDADDILVRLNLSTLTASWQRLGEQLTARRAAPSEVQRTPEEHAILVRDAGLKGTEEDTSASEALSRVLDKADFSSMEVVGQFNKGFIVTRLRKDSRKSYAEPLTNRLDDLFIVDQHAADEKYNFERLQTTTRIEAQKLYHPLALELTAADELVALENLNVLRENGFEVAVDGGDSVDGGRHLSLISQPVSKNTVFDMKDLEELIHLMHDQPKGHMIRCSKARSMFAMRACRSSVMVGTVLKAQQMLSVVRNMGSMDQPWHCPHGRPTMRHLSDIAGMGWNRDGPGTIERRRLLDFSALS